MDLREFCHKLPKAELHAHLNGSLGEKTLLKLGAPADELQKYLIKNMDNDEDTLRKAFSLFKVAHNVTNTKENVYLAAKDVIEDFYHDNVVYLELRSTPRSSETMTKTEYIESIVKAIQTNISPIVVKLILCLDRRHEFNDSRDTLNLIIAAREKYPDIIVGVDLCGDPYVLAFHKELFEIARNNGLRITLHCAEVNSQEEIKNIIDFTPDRIGHGTFLHPDFGGEKATWDLFVANPIPLEVCITSNVLSGTSRGITEHHVSKWLELGFNFSLCTDDSGVFDTTLSEEFYKCALHHNLNNNQLYEITIRAIRNSFASVEEQEQLLTNLAKWKQENARDF